MSLSWKIFSGFMIGFLFLPIVIMIDKYVGPGAGTIIISMLTVGACVAVSVWLIELMRGMK